MTNEPAMALPRDCILFSTADWHEPYWTNKQHTATEMAKRGVRVLYVESVGLRAPRVGSRRDWARLWRRLRTGLRSFLFGPARVAPNVWVPSPLLVPAGHHLPLVHKLNQWLMQFTLHRFVRRMRFDRPLVWTYHPFVLASTQHLDRGRLVYHCVDDLAAVPGVDVPAFRHAESELLARADVVFVTSEKLRDTCARLNQQVHYLPNVADVDHFSTARNYQELPPELAAVPPPRIGYIGVLSDFKVDFELVKQVVEARPDWHWILIGEEREGQASPMVRALRSCDNVHFLGYRAYADLPRYLAGMDVGALPTLLNEYTSSMFPMKFFEYIAAGVPVVSTDLPAIRSHAGARCRIADGPAGFIDQVAELLKGGKIGEEESLRLVGDNSWSVRLDRMFAILGNLPTGHMAPDMAGSLTSEKMMNG